MKLTDFSFTFTGHGHYKVAYTSPKTGKSWSKTISDMTLIDRTLNAENPLQKDLNQLKSTIKNW
jgi:hypothetical protein